MALNAATAWTAIKAAKAAAKSAYLADKDFPLSSSEVLELIDEMEEAGYDALFAHFASAAVVSFSADVISAGLANGGGAVTGTLTVGGGSIA